MSLLSWRCKCWHLQLHIHTSRRTHLGSQCFEYIGRCASFATLHYQSPPSTLYHFHHYVSPSLHHSHFTSLVCFNLFHCGWLGLFSFGHPIFFCGPPLVPCTMWKQRVSLAYFLKPPFQWSYFLLQPILVPFDLFLPFLNSSKGHKRNPLHSTHAND